MATPSLELLRERRETAKTRFYLVIGKMSFGVHNNYRYVVVDALKEPGHKVIGKFQDKRYAEMFLRTARALYIKGNNNAEVPTTGEEETPAANSRCKSSEGRR